MYHYLRGALTEKNPTQAVVDVGGVGYEIAIPLSTYRALPECGELVQVHTHLVVREDAQQLFGFATEEERTLFRLLISVSGIGPKIALTVLSGVELGDLKRAIIHEDLARLTSVSGIGRKTAERIIIELREKVLLDDKWAAKKDAQAPAADEALVQDTLLVLVSLGYKKPTAQDAIRKVLTSSPGGDRLSVEELVRATLKVI